MFLETCSLVQTSYSNICVVLLTFVVCSRQLWEGRRCRISHNAVIFIPIHLIYDTVWYHITVKNCTKSCSNRDR